MSRQLRLEHAGAIWHITSRGNERRDIFRDDRDRRRFLTLLARVVDDRRWRLHAWVLMSNHYHLLVETPEVGLSRGMKWLNQQYAEAFNSRHDRVGHLFQGRFKGILVERDSHLLELLRYIVLNPVRAGSVRFAGDHEWSSYRATAGLDAPPRWLEIDWTLQQFSADRRAAHEAYRQFVADARGASYKPWEVVLGQIYLGSATFRNDMQRLVDARERSREHPSPQRQYLRPQFEKAVALVCDRYAMSVEDLRRKSRGHARKALCQLAVEDCGHTLRQAANWLRMSDWAASKLYSAARELYANDRQFRETIDGVRDELS